jgi:CSLREA domain-containing protein/uncharacterized repeat protein (TIGR01451 family)
MKRSSNQLCALILTLAIVGIFMFASLVPAMAATFSVNSTVDAVDVNPGDGICETAPGNGICTLRAAIQEANALTEASTINMSSGTYVLTQSTTCTFQVTAEPSNVVQFLTTSLCLSRDITLNGDGADTTVIDGNRISGNIGVAAPVMFVSYGATVEINGVTMKKGNFSVGSLFGHGGGIRNSGMLTLADCVLSENFTSGSGGGAVYNTGDLTVIRSILTLNVTTQNGGAIGNFANSGYAGGTVRVSDSIISSNIGADGGGISNFSGTVIITNSTIYGNSASQGGGISNGASSLNTMTLTNVTVSGNLANSAGGILNGFKSTMHLNNVTIANNTAQWSTDPTRGIGGGLLNGDQAVVTLQNTLIGGNFAVEAGSDCYSASRAAVLTSQGYNLIQNTADCDITGDTTGNITGQDPKVAILGNYGGIAPTHALLTGSPAIDAGNPSNPGSGGTACTSLDERGIARPQPVGGRCDIGAFELQGGFLLSAISPKKGGNMGSVLALAYGNGFVNGATIRLTRAGQSDIVANSVTLSGGAVLTTNLDLTGKATGAWDVVVTNPDGSSVTLPGGFTIESGLAPQLWIDVIGRTVLRPGQPGTFYIAFGNRGNVDALGVPFVFAIPSNFAFNLEFLLAPPPPHVGQVTTDWSQAAFNEVSTNQPDLTFIPLLMPVVPAGFTGTLQLTLTPLTGAEGDRFEIPYGIHSPYFKPDLDPQIISEFVDGALTYAQQNLGVTIAATVIPTMQQYISAQLESEVAQGRNAWLASAGTQPEFYSLAHLIRDLAQFGVAQTALLAGQADPPVVTRQQLVAAQSVAKTNQAGTPVINLDQFEASRPAIQMSVAQPPAMKWLSSLRRFLASIARLIVSALFEPSEAEACDDANGQPGSYIICSGCTQPICCAGLQSTCCFSFSCPKPAAPNCTGSQCSGGGSSGGSIGGSIDPNDKVGSQGVSDALFLSGQEPLHYTIFFENLATATLPAQVVVITDQLDAQKMDLTTFSLGPIVYQGGKSVVPPPGLSQFTDAVDLRPAHDLILRIDAGLDNNTGIVSWRFTALDPATLQLTQDPLAGFLPPDINPPEGQGNVLFTVMPKTGLSTGTQITNQAQVVFDVNAPISTPQWLNTIDITKPISHVLSLNPTQGSASFTVQWAGTDEGSGIRDFTIVVSDNGGPFNPFVSNTTDTSATFTGQNGHTYAFYSVAADLVGNLEDDKTVADASTKVVIGSSDDIPPSSTSLVSPAPNGTGWNNSDVTVTLSAFDNPGGSGVKQIAYSASGALSIGNTTISGALASITIAAEGQTTVTFFAIDNADNVEAPKSVIVKLDKTPPTISGSRTPPNGHDWSNSDVTVSFACIDSLSGLAAGSPSAPTVVSGEGAGQSVTGTCKDTAGNSSTLTLTNINIDKTPPTIVGAGTPAANANGWNNSDVTVSFVCSDSLSGIDTCGPTPQVVSTEGKGQSRMGTAVDLAGNTASATVSEINIDKTPPVVICNASPNLLWPANHKMVTVNTSVSVVDALSGSDRFTLTSVTSNEQDTGLGSGDFSNDIQGFDIGTQDTKGQLRSERFGQGNGRIYTLTYKGMDVAGNSATCNANVTVPHDRGK